MLKDFQTERKLFVVIFLITIIAAGVLFSFQPNKDILSIMIFILAVVVGAIFLLSIAMGESRRKNTSPEEILKQMQDPRVIKLTKRYERVMLISPILMLIFIVVIVIVSFYGAQKKDTELQQINSQQQVQQAKIDTSDWQTYRNEELRFSFEYPDFLGSLKISRHKYVYSDGYGYYGTFSGDPSFVFNTHSHPYPSMGSNFSGGIIDAARTKSISMAVKQRLPEMSEVREICGKDVLLGMILLCGGGGGCNLYPEYYVVGSGINPLILNIQPPSVFSAKFGNDERIEALWLRRDKNDPEVQELTKEIIQSIIASQEFDQIDRSAVEKVEFVDRGDRLLPYFGKELFPIVNSMICSIEFDA